MFLCRDNLRDRKFRPTPHDSHGRVGQLLLGEVEGVVGHGDAIDTRVFSCRKISPQDSVAADAEEGYQAVPRHVVEPHLHKQKGH